MTGFLILAFLILVASVVAVPLASRFGLGSVLGYLLAGMAISPLLAALRVDVEALQVFAEFGVVMMLFIIGLEMEPQRLWEMRGKLAGLGGGQVLLTTLVIAGIALIDSRPWQTALAIGMVLALSSTAIIVQTLTEKGLLRTEGGEASFSVLLVQDVAVIPILALLPLLALPELAGAGAMQGGEAAHHGIDLTAHMPGWMAGVTRIGAVAAVIAIGIFAIRPLFRYIAKANLRELFTAAALVVVFAFFFVTVSSRIVGLVGVTANPTSGMTIATLLATSSVFLLLGWTDDSGKVAALTVGAVVAVAASIAGDTSQDLKTGFLLGATPRRQQLGELVGVLTSAAFVALTVLLLARAYGFGGEELPAPQAMLMRLVIDGVLAQSLPWTLVALGAGIAIVVELLRIPSLPFAVGVYLPLSTMMPVFLGGLLRLVLHRRAATDEERLARHDRGILLGSGLVGGEGLIGVVIAGAAGWAVSRGQTPWSLGFAWAGAAADWLALALFVALITFFWRRVAPAERS